MMATPKTFTMTFYECEHQGDLSRYLEELRRCGATVLGYAIDSQTEEGVARIEVPDFRAFRTAWEQTDSSDFADSLGWLEDDDENP